MTMLFWVEIGQIVPNGLVNLGMSEEEYALLVIRDPGRFSGPGLRRHAAARVRKNVRGEVALEGVQGELGDVGDAEEAGLRGVEVVGAARPER